MKVKVNIISNTIIPFGNIRYGEYFVPVESENIFLKQQSEHYHVFNAINITPRTTSTQTFVLFSDDSPGYRVKSLTITAELE